MKECITKTFKVECEDSTHEQRHEAIEASQEQMLATLFMCDADQDCCGELMVDLKNEFSPKVDNCPSTLDEACQKLVNCTPKHPKQETRRQPDRPNPNRRNDNRETRDGQGGREIAFTQAEDPPAAPGTAATLTLIAGTDGRTHNVKCHGCQQVGHHRSQCPNNGPSGTGSGTASGTNTDTEAQLLMNAEFSDFSFLNAALHAMPQGMIPSSWIPLDNQSTICCFKDKECLQNIHRANRSVTIHCNAGDTTTDLIGDLPGFPEPVWHDPKGIANVLSLDRVEEHFDVSCQNKTFCVHKPDGATRQFVRATNGLRHWDTKSDSSTVASSEPNTLEK